MLVQMWCGCGAEHHLRLDLELQETQQVHHGSHVSQHAVDSLQGKGVVSSIVISCAVELNSVRFRTCFAGEGVVSCNYIGAAGRVS